MSFYDFTKDNVLSANELFKYRLKRDATVPSKGGQKAYEPDGSWMHAKALESFIQERTNILGEQRVEKIKSLVQGVWEQEKRLVDLNKPGKFWAHMGFTDERRNWLYPEEALFLMETNTMEVYHCGLPMSIQEAYGKLIGPGLSVEEYQVYAHLRRLGYVVLRQGAEVKITSYERQINLDKYMSKQARKDRKQKPLAQGKSSAQSGNSSEMFAAFGELSNSADSKDPTPAGSTDVTMKDASDLPGPDSVKRNLFREDESECGTPSKKLKTDTSDENPKLEQSSAENKSLSASEGQCMSWFLDSSWAECFKSPLKDNTQESGSDTDKLSDKVSTKRDTDKTFPLPTIANKSMLSLMQPWPKLLPPNVDVNEDYNDILVFNVDRYRSQHPLPNITRNEEMEGERDNHIKSLDFSFAEWVQRKKPRTDASSWAEFKQAEPHKQGDAATSSTPVDHLWSGNVTPLVRPGDALNKQSILDRLSIIQSADNETLLPNQDCMVDLKVSFSVHLPDSRFKKSMPGCPNHRVCVIKCSAEPPNLAEVQEVWSRFKDGVPLHCAVVDSGEIAFYIFDNTFKLEVLP